MAKPKKPIKKAASQEPTPRVLSRPWMARFLVEFARCCNIKDAAALAGIGRTAVHYAKERDEAFAAAWQEAREEAADRIRAEVVRRAIDGWEEPVFGRIGKDRDGQIGTIRRYDSMLLARLAVAHCPEFRTKGALEQTVNINITIGPERLQSLQERTRSRLSRRTDGLN